MLHLTVVKQNDPSIWHVAFFLRCTPPPPGCMWRRWLSVVLTVGLDTADFVREVTLLGVAVEQRTGGALLHRAATAPAVQKRVTPVYRRERGGGREGGVVKHWDTLMVS